MTIYVSNKGISNVTEFWGDRMPIMCMEECGELIQAISKRVRKRTPETKQNLKEEIRDMFISVMAIMVLENITHAEIEEMIHFKFMEKIDD